MTTHRRRHASYAEAPTSIRGETFQRKLRGLDPGQVYAYLNQMADQAEQVERELIEARVENDKLQAKLRQVQSELDEYEQIGDRVNEQVVQLFSQAQLVAEEMVQDVSRDARERIGHARAQEREIVDAAIDTAGQQVRSYARSAHAQMQSMVDTFAGEIERLGSTPPVGGGGRHQSSPPTDA